MPSGADLEYARMLARAGVPAATAQGYDAARLEQIGDDYEQSPTKSLKELSTAFGNEAILVENYPRLEGETQDAPRILRAIAASVANGTYTVFFGAKTYTISSTIEITTSNIRLIGTGWQTVLSCIGLNTIAIHFNGTTACELKNLCVRTYESNRTVYPVKCTNANRPVFSRIFFEGQTDSWRSGVHTVGGSEGNFSNCLFSHACAQIETFDVKFDSCYIWSMTNEFCVGLLGGAGNLTLNNCDFVPPFRSKSGAKAGVYIQGPALQVKILGCYLDGNGTFATKEGIMITNGCGQVIIQGVTSNNMASDCIVLDSCYNVLIDGYSGYSNNRYNNNSREIVVKQTGAQPIQNIRISNTQFLQTQAVQDGGTAQPAIEVLSGVDGNQVSIDSFDVKQPGAGGGYSNPEIKVPKSGNHPTVRMSGRGTLSNYIVSGSQAVSNGDTAVSINLSLPYPMAYRPKPHQIFLTMEGAMLPSYRIQYIGDNQIYVPFATAISGSGTIFWSVDLSR